MLALGYKGYRPKDGFVHVVDGGGASIEAWQPSRSDHRHDEVPMFQMEKVEEFELVLESEVVSAVEALINAKSEPHMLAFIRQYGFPTNPIYYNHPPSSVEDIGEPHPNLSVEVAAAMSCVSHINRMSRNLLNGSDQSFEREIDSYRGLFKAVPNAVRMDFYWDHDINKVTPRLWTKNLSMLAYIHILNRHNSSKAYLSCTNCGNFFAPKNSRSGKAYCGGACRTAASRKRNAK